MDLKSIILAGMILGLLPVACAPASTPEPTPTAPADLTWGRIQSTGKMIVGTAGDYAPFEYYNDQFQLDGFDVALIQAIGQKLGLRVELDNFAFDGLSGALKIGQVDAAIAAISVTDERQAVVDFSNVYYVDTGVALARKDSGITGLSSIAQLTQHRVGVKQGSVYQSALQRVVEAGAMPASNVLAYTKAYKGVAALREGAVDLFLLDEASASEFVAQGGVEIAGQAVSQQRYAIAIPQGAAKLQAELNRALVELNNDGTLALLTDQYLGPHPGTILPTPAEATSAPVATPTPSTAACIDGMAYLEDLSHDDENMQDPPELEKGESFEKGWRVRNVGTCAWTGQYSLRYVYGNSPEAQMAGTPTAIVFEVTPGQTYDIYVSLKAPTESGSYQGFWQMFNANGHAFGETIWVGISIPEDQPTPTATSVPEATATSGPLPTWTPTPPPVVGPTWQLALISDESGTPVYPVPGSIITLSFAADNTVSGSTGCNSYTARYTARESSLSIKGVDDTQLACPTEELNSQEKRFLSRLERTTAYALAGNQLELFTGENLTLVFLAQ